MENFHFNLDMILVGALYLSLVFDILCCFKKKLSHKNDTKSNHSIRNHQFKSRICGQCLASGREMSSLRFSRQGSSRHFVQLRILARGWGHIQTKPLGFHSKSFSSLSDETVRIAFKVNQTCDMPINASIERKKSLEFSFFLFEVILKYMYRKSNIDNFLFKPHAILTTSKTVQKD